MSAAKYRRSIPEREVESYLQDQVLAHGGFCYLVAPRGTKGPPDCVVVWPRDGWAMIHLVEVKTVGGGLDDHQLAFHEVLKLFHCHVRVVWDKRTVDRYVEEHGARPRKEGVTMAGLLAAVWKKALGLKVPRREKKVAIRLAPVPVEEFGAEECNLCDDPGCDGIHRG